MNPTAAQIAGWLESWAPLTTQAGYDNSGFQCGTPQAPVTGVVTCLDVTTEVLDEAIASGANLVIAHHPAIFRKLSSVTAGTPAGDLLIRALTAGLTIYALHTPADAAAEGVSWIMAGKLGVQQPTFLMPDANGRTGMGAIGDLIVPVSQHELLMRIAHEFSVPALRYSGNAPYISRIAVCGGSGADLIDAAAAAGAQAYITADIKYHAFFPPRPDFLLVDTGHYESEIPFVSVLAERIHNAFPNLPVQAARVCTNPVQHFITRSEHSSV